ncbi:MAG TPA: prenyltransferase/squalene oxidase repeat-containing protein [Planctomycetota bacterium]|nr:prenyltransferase/squalene oxidase repeat-containing protein [Planctomycetota bacterium]
MLSFAVVLSFLLPQEAPPERHAAPRGDVVVEKAPTAPPDPAKEAAAKGLVFLEKEGVAWTRKNTCASCHHVPMMLWAQREVRQHGMSIHEEARDLAIAFALKAPHAGFLGPLTREQFDQMSGPSLEVLYLTLGIGPASLPEPAATTLAEFKKHLLEKQAPDGSWVFTRKEKGKILPPIQDTDDVITMLGMLALSSGEPSSLDPQALKKSQDQALSWLKAATSEHHPQSTALRLVIFQSCGMKERVEPLATQLLREQREDGGWSQVEGFPSDALATGQALYALAACGIPRKHEAIQRGRTYLARTQRDDGSWLVLSRIPTNKGKDAIPSYFGSAWAVLGLVQHLSRE